MTHKSLWSYTSPYRKPVLDQYQLALNRAEKAIKGYEMAAIEATEEAFNRAVSRRPERMNLAYFFGILKRIQQERDDEAYRE